MTDPDLSRLLRRAVPPVGAEAPRRDLWHDIRLRLERGGGRVPWLDWAIAAAAAAASAALPKLLPALLYIL